MLRFTHVIDFSISRFFFFKSFFVYIDKQNVATAIIINAIGIQSIIDNCTFAPTTLKVIGFSINLSLFSVFCFWTWDLPSIFFVFDNHKIFRLHTFAIFFVIFFCDFLNAHLIWFCLTKCEPPPLKTSFWSGGFLLLPPLR